MQIEWQPEARAELLQILEHISDRHHAAAMKLFKGIEAATSKLTVHPCLYRSGRVAGTREIVVHPNYLVIYQVADHVRVLSVLHARQEYP
ncbi:type II toxin-antitoxin system RelE/ParE family toxin [Pseudomonas sp. B35(2017)]|uniref:type II toxin-antitoxin system RelE/ParE family toxin n=1 Tax=Pseudomonas sp. B35(2017) TaxID=1981722 RepID=UPI000A1DF3C3|nr:type II toxin-antitoxin system RelE/ParE family toxin [Pseudomonas sp. B35(2017)]